MNSQAVAEAMVCSKSLARRRLRLSHAKVRSTTQRRGSTSKPFAASDRLMISMVHLLFPILRKGTSCGQQRSSILAKGREASSAPTPIESGPLAALVEAHGDALRVYADAELVRRTLTGTEAPFASAAAYVALQHVYRARERGVTVVDLGARTHYDPKTVYYLVKLLLERELVAKFTARETGEVSNYVVGRPFLAHNALWQAQQRAAGPSDVGTPTWVDLDTIASEWDDAPLTGEADEDEAGALAMPPLDPHDGDVLAYPMLSDEQSAVWLHSRQDLLSERLALMLRMSPSHMTPRRYLPTRLGLRRGERIHRRDLLLADLPAGFTRLRLVSGARVDDARPPSHDTRSPA